MEQKLTLPNYRYNLVDGYDVTKVSNYYSQQVDLKLFQNSVLTS